MKRLLSSLALISAFLLSAQFAFAHAVVKPAQVGIGAFQVFTLGVPSEKPVATVAVRLMLPDGLNFVTPNVKPGWKVEVKTAATGKQVKDDDGMMVAEQKPVEINWTGGSIPAGQRDEFNFQAQVPATATTLNWKVYQTYSDGSVVNWDQDPNAMTKTPSGQMDMSKGGPYSMTKVVDDLSPKTDASQNQSMAQGTPKTGMLPIVVSVIALVLAAWAVFKKNN